MFMVKLYLKKSNEKKSVENIQILTSVALNHFSASVSAHLHHIHKNVKYFYLSFYSECSMKFVPSFSVAGIIVRITWTFVS